MQEEDHKYELEQDITVNQVSPYYAFKKAHINSIQTIAAHPGHKQFASGSHDKTIKLWDLTKQKEIMVLSDHKQGVWSLQYSNDGTQLLSGSCDKTIRQWDSKKGSVGNKYLGHKDKVYSAKFNESNKQIASIGEGGQLLIWDVAKGNAPIKTINLGVKVGYDIEWSKNSQLMFVSTYGSKIFAFDAKTFDLLGQETVTKNEPDSRCQNLDCNFQTFPGRVFVGTDRGHIAWYKYNGKKLEKQTEFIAHLEPVRSVTLHTKLKYLLTGGKSGSARIWDCNVQGHPKVIGNLAHHTQNVTRMVFLNDEIVLSSSWDQSIGCWKMSDILANYQPGK